mgnify:CR=1 FL=1
MGIGSTNRLCFQKGPRDTQPTRSNSWKMLIVDDEDSVHHVTKLALRDFMFAGRGLEFLSAYSGEEAIELLESNEGIALVLLDVVMESDDAGLLVAKHIRETLNNKSTRIILRTGQAGYAPERQVVMEYDINDYKEKTDLTATKLFSTVYTALRAYRDILALQTNRKGLEMILESSATMFQTRDISEFAQGVLEQLIALLFVDPDAVYCQTEGIATRARGDRIEIIAATGLHAELIGRDISDLSDLALADAIRAARERKTNVLWAENTYAAYFQTESGHENIICVRGPQGGDGNFSSLMDLFLRNVSIAFENIHLQDDLSQEVVERREAERAATLLARLPGELPEPVMRISETGVISFANEHSAPILDYFGAAIGEELPETWREHIKVLLRDRQRFDMEIEHKDRIFELSLSPVPEAGYVNFFGRDVTQLRQILDKLEYVAFHDHLTGIANRRYFRDQLERSVLTAKRKSDRVGLMMLDLDAFKQINDAWGHDTGDAVLKMVASRLKDLLRGSDIVARLGGDEFGIILTSLDSVESMSRLAERVLAKLKEPYEINGSILRSGCSVGLAAYPHDAKNANDLQQCADLAMYHAKNKSGGYHFFDDKLQKKARQRLDMEVNLREALDKERFQIFYQPIVDLADDRIIGAEALLRLRRPDQTIVPPVEFIPIAEQTGLIEPIGDWVLERACKDVRSWLDQGFRAPRISFNVSGVQLRSSDLARRIESILSQNGVPPRLLEAEVTESVLVHANGNASKLLHEIREIGLSVAIDDFGTGYSSLSYLRHLPVSKLKVDRSFVMDMLNSTDAMAIVDAILSLGNSLRLRVLAEGIELSEQKEILRAKGCVEGQGFHFGVPVPAEEFEQFLGKA